MFTYGFYETIYTLKSSFLSYQICDMGLKRAGPRKCKKDQKILFMLACLNIVFTRTKQTELLKKETDRSVAQERDDDLKISTPGARFIDLWHYKYRGDPSQEAQRIMSCGSMRGPPTNKNLCLAGSKGYEKQKLHQKGQAPQQDLGLPLWEDDPKKINTHTILYASNGTKWIPSLGTYISCIPLLLAGYSAISSKPDIVLLLSWARLQDFLVDVL